MTEDVPIPHDPTDTPLLRDAMTALEDRFFRTGEPADDSAVARIAERFDLAPEEVAALQASGKRDGLLAEELHRLERPTDTDSPAGELTVPWASQWSSLHQLFGAARRYPLLTPQQEKDLARRYQLGQRAADRLKAGRRLTPVVRLDLQAQVSDGTAAKNRFILSNLRLVASIARGHQNRSHTRLSLLHLCDLVDPSDGHASDQHDRPRHPCS